MAVSTSSYFSNAIQGIPGVGADFNIFDVHTTPRYAIGTKACKQDGKEYAYAHFGAATGPGLLCSQDLSESSLVDSDNIVIAPASAVTTSDGTIGSKFLQVTLAAITADQYAGGNLHITDDTGEGYNYRIKGNTATDNPTTGDIRIELYDPLQVALDATSDIAITGNLYANLEGATTTDVAASGVSCADMAAGEYGWVQTAGIATVLTDGVIVLGSGVKIGSVAGSVAVEVAGEILERVGYCYIVGDDTGYSSIKLTLK